MFKLTGNSQIDRLNNLALKLAKNENDGFGVLSKGEQCYVALASNRIDLLESIGYTIPEEMIAGLSATIANELLGQSVIYRVFVAVGQLLASSIKAMTRQKEDTLFFLVA